MDPFVVHATVVIVTTAVAIAVFLSLAIYIVTQNLYRPTAWLFSLACLIIAGAYFASFFLVSGSKSSLLLFLRLRWAAIIFGPTLFLHLIVFYFPPPWQRYRVWMLSAFYVLSFILAAVTLLTDLVIAAPIPQHAPHIAIPLPGPLMAYQIGFFFLQLLGITAGLIQSYRHIRSTSLQCQLRLLILPTTLVFIASMLHCFSIFIGETFPIPHEIPDGLLLLAAFCYLKAMIHYGSFIGRPLAWRHLFYGGLGAVGGLVSLYLTFMLDRWLTAYNYFPYPPATAILVLVVAAGFPATQGWLLPLLDRRLFPWKTQQESLTDHVAETMAAQTNHDCLFNDLLETICLLLDVPHGFIAEANTTDILTVRAIRGSLPLQSGDRLIVFPAITQTRNAQLLLPGHLAQLSAPIWSEMALLCPIPLDGFDGLLMLADKENGIPFTAQEIALCTDLTQRTTYRLMARRFPTHDASPIALASLSAGSDQKIASETPTSITTNAAPPIEIHLLGPLRVTRDGQPVPESEWGSEKAKLMLAYLLWKSPHGATREELSALLWPDRPPEEAANVFHVTLHRLRRVFQPKTKAGQGVKYILYDRSRYRFNDDAPHQLDVTEFQTLAANADIIAQKTAVDHYKGPYLEDTIWALPAEVEVERRRLEQLYADTLRRLAAQSDERSAILYLEKLLTVEPADEAARRTLILSYLAQGRDDLVRRHLDYWQRILAELELEPLPETLTFWKTIQAKAVYSLNGFTN